MVAASIFHFLKKWKYLLQHCNIFHPFFASFNKSKAGPLKKGRKLLATLCKFKHKKVRISCFTSLAQDFIDFLICIRRWKSIPFASDLFNFMPQIFKNHTPLSQFSEVANYSTTFWWASGRIRGLPLVKRGASFNFKRGLPLLTRGSPLFPGNFQGNFLEFPRDFQGNPWEIPWKIS